MQVDHLIVVFKQTYFNAMKILISKLGYYALKLKIFSKMSKMFVIFVLITKAKMIKSMSKII